MWWCPLRAPLHIRERTTCGHASGRRSSSGRAPASRRSRRSGRACKRPRLWLPLWRRPESATRDVRRPMGRSSKEEAVLSRLVLLFWAMAATLLMASGAALAEDIEGTEGPDNLVGTTGDDTIDGREGGDFILCESVLFAAGGTDTLTGGPGDDEVYGTSGNDEVAGTLGSDVVYGDEGDDLVDGGAPFDALGDAHFGGAGNDVMDAYQRP